MATEPTANEAFLDALIRHQIYLLRLSDSIRKKVETLLNDSEQDLAEKIRDRLRNTNGLTTSEDFDKLNTLLRIIKNLRAKSWEQIDETWAEELTAISKAEPETLSKILITTSPVIVETILPAPRLLAAIVESNPFEGRTLKQWAASVQEEDLRRIHSAIRLGMVAGEPSDAIARRVVGTARLKGVDGMTEITRRNATAITRTAVNFIANESRTEFFKQNSDLFDEEQFVATLDSRTTPICRANDGKKFPIGTGPRPPLHFNCRSLRVPVIGGDALGNRPAKPVTEKMLLREFAQQQGIPTPTKRSGLPKGTKTKYDNFARKRIRELTGQVPAVTDYQNWLMKQSKDFQDDILGKTKAMLFRGGGLKLDKFVNESGREFTLSELASKHADAFRAAGLDPSAFK